MERFTTYTQQKILKDYWQNHTPFSVASLIKKGILHSPMLGRLTLHIMESRGQILDHCERDGEFIYIATTESETEWDDIWRKWKICAGDFSASGEWATGMNRYERQELCDRLEQMILDYVRGEDTLDS